MRYRLNRDETKIAKITIAMPNGYGKKPLWFIDLEVPQDGSMVVMGRTPVNPTAPRVLVRKGAVQMRIEQ
jgi:hypothetical protein